MPDQYTLSDLHTLRDDVELAVRVPALEELAAVAHSRRRTRLALAAVAAVAAVVVAALSMTGGGRGRALVPATGPTSAAGPVVTASALPSTSPGPVGTTGRGCSTTKCSRGGLDGVRHHRAPRGGGPVEHRRG